MIRWSILWLLVLALIVPPVRAAQLPSGIAASTLLGTTTTATLTLDNTGQPATQAQLFESWPLGAKGDVDTSPLRVPVPVFPDEIDPQLLRDFAAAPNGQSTMIVFLKDQANLRPAALIEDWNQRGEAVVKTLRAHAARSQAQLLLSLREAGYEPHAFWVINAVTVRGDLALARVLASRADVGAVMANTQHILDTPQIATAAQLLPTSAPWGLNKIQAPRVWQEWGIRGQGIVIANIDTGVEYSHTALLQNYRGWSPTVIDHDYNWYDPTSSPYAVATDPDGHGTHTMGTMIGGAAGPYSTIGVAPDAKWIAARGCASHLCDDADLIASAQWMLAPTRRDGSEPRPDLRPHIINNSWAGETNNPWYQGYVQAWNAAGILSVFAAGNRGAFGCGTTQSPGDYSETVSVAATDSNDLAASFSSRGPTVDGRIKPDVSAPGVNVESSWPGGGMLSLNGTSMAAPHVAGLVALLWSANPTLIGNLEQTNQILHGTSVGLYSDQCDSVPNLRPNSVYGWGRVDAYAALQEAKVDVPWLIVPQTFNLPANAQVTLPITLDARQVTESGTYSARVLVRRADVLQSIDVTFTVTDNPDAFMLQGRLTDARTHQPIYGHLQLLNGPKITSDYSGGFLVNLLAGAYSFNVLSTGYISQTINFNVPDTDTLALALVRDAPELRLTAPLISDTLAFGASATTTFAVENRGTQPLNVIIDVPSDEWSVETSALTPTLYDLSSMTPLSLSDDLVYTQSLELGFDVPMFGGWADQIYVSSNGWVSTRYQKSALPGAYCLPGGGVPASTFAPFWADLDPSQGGAVRAGQVDSATFVVSYEQVPLWRESPAPSDPTYTFQIVFHADGRIEYLYGDMGRVPTRWSVGVGYSNQRGQRLACGPMTLNLSYQRWTLMNQAAADQWLNVQPAVMTVAPGATQTIEATLRGLGYMAWRDEPAQGRIRLQSDDPLLPLVEVPASVSVGPPTARLFLPQVSRR